MRKNIAKLLISMLVFGTVIGAAGCSKKEEPKPSTEQTATETPATEAPATETPTEQTGSEQSSETAGGTAAVDGMDPLAAKLLEEFQAQAAAGKTPKEIAEVLGKEDFCGYDCNVEACAEGYLAGFSAEVSGFKSGASFLPWIGSIPFAGYVFETESEAAAAEFAAKLQEIADPMWNICTEAQDPVIGTSGALVFITMVPAEQ